MNQHGQKADIGIIGLGVMGRMLALNMERNGYTVAGYDLSEETVRAFEEEHPEKRLVGCTTLEGFLKVLERPRRIMVMVPSGKPVDAVIVGLKPLLDEGDLLIDGGNSFFKETERRSRELEAQDVLYLGTGVSGGEYGALWGPSIMPGGQRQGWELVQPIFEEIAARVDDEPCVAYIGPAGAGHYVKMVHNGIEYGMMQLIAETYDLLHRGLGLSTEALYEIFTAWNEAELNSYLVEITAAIFTMIDESVGRSLIDVILDEAKQKGTGKWTSQNAMDVGVPTPTIDAAVQSRIISAYKAERVEAAAVLEGPEAKVEGDRDEIVQAMRDALFAAIICTYAQGFALLRAASQEYDYDLDLSAIARIWRGGCIIRARFLEEIRAAYQRHPDLKNLLIDEQIGKQVGARQGALRRAVEMMVAQGLPAAAFSATLAYFDAYRNARLPANLIQAQRDYFGAHTYRRTDQSGFFHTKWVDMEIGPTLERE
ncbi:MAG: NADP-dependent phosphogluconate dehydrogenase [Anaerolineales bacterium]